LVLAVRQEKRSVTTRQVKMEQHQRLSILLTAVVVVRLVVLRLLEHLVVATKAQAHQVLAVKVTQAAVGSILHRLVVAAAQVERVLLVLAIMVAQVAQVLLMPMTVHQRPMRQAAVVLVQRQVVQVSRMFQATVRLVQVRRHLVRLIVAVAVAVRQAVRLVLVALV
jgi:hypothetical protein